jgi:hypothetical protein
VAGDDGEDRERAQALDVGAEARRGGRRQAEGSGIS